MAIPESQLETWSHQGSVTTAKATHESIRKALALYKWPAGVNYEVYLQGSYKNDTNIRGDSDVDIVVQLNSSFQYDLSALSEDEKRLFGQNHPTNATYLWADFRNDVLKAMQAYYDASAVTEGNKSMKLARASGRLPADVVVCIQYRKYSRFRSLSDQRYIEGIAFYTRTENRQTINYPKPHYDNGVSKNSSSSTNGEYKPAVRVFKNARTYLSDKGVIVANLAPSYFLECLIYNVPDSAFSGSHEDTFCNAVNWLRKAGFTSFVCQNALTFLFGNSPEQWTTEKASQFLNAMANLWNNWR